MTMFRLATTLLVLASLGGCAVGQRLDYRESSPHLTARSYGEVAVAVLDERPYVRSGSKNQTYVGTLRALYYNPFNVTTLSGGPLASDIQDAIRSSLARSSIKAVSAISATKASRGQKLLVLTLREWKTDT